MLGLPPHRYLYLHFGRHPILDVSAAARSATYVEGAYVARVADGSDEALTISLVAFGDDVADFERMKFAEMLRRRTMAAFIALDARVPVARQSLDERVDGDPVVASNARLIDAALRIVIGALVYLKRPDRKISVAKTKIEGVGVMDVHVCSAA